MDYLEDAIDSAIAGQPVAVDTFMALNGEASLPEIAETNSMMNPHEEEI